MHIIGALLAILGVVAIILWRLNQAAEVARNATDAIGEAQGLWRRFLWRRKANKHPLDLIEDPREAAAAMMVSIAQEDGALTAREEADIIAQMAKTFAIEGKLAQDLLAQARFATKDGGDLSSVLRRLTRPIQAKCTPDERRELMAMLRAIAGPAAQGETSEGRAIRSVEERLLQQR